MRKPVVVVVGLACAMALLGGCGNPSSVSKDDVSEASSASSSESVSAEAASASEDSADASSASAPVESGAATAESTGEQKEDEKDVTKSAKLVKLRKEYSTSSGLEFRLFKIATSAKLKALGVRGYSYSADDGNKYIDVVLEVTNSGKREAELHDNVDGAFVDADGNVYEDFLAATETGDGQVDRYGSIKPQATMKVHLGYEVPEAVTAGKASFAFGEDAFCVNYDADKEVSSKKALSPNEVVKVDGLASFELLSTSFTQDVLPPDTSGYYTHYEISDPANYTYLVAYCNLTNESASAIGSEDMLSMSVTFDKQYQYSSFMVLEETDGTGFDYSNITGINPLETRRIAFLCEVPKKLEGTPFELLFYFYGNEYSYTS